MQVRVLLFATLRDLAGERAITLNLPGTQTDLATVRAALSERYPHLADNLKVALAAINEDYAFAGDVVSDGDEVAFFPPVSGGSDESPEICRLADAPLNHDDLIAAITTPATGAVCVFSGMVRGQTQREGHVPQTSHLVYEAYETMAVAKMRQVAAEIRQRWPLVLGIAMVQRVGELYVGQNTILIACGSGHRDEGCFEAARYGIDRLKEIVPVWKKEVGPDGQSWVEGDYIPGPDDRA